MKKDVLTTYKAMPNGRAGSVPSLIIKAELSIPYDPKDSLSTVAEIYAAEGRKLEEALLHHLPGGVYDALLGAMMSRRASHFIAPLEKPSSNG